MIFSTIIAIFAIFISIVIHEIAHGWVAYILGDKTAKNNQRLSLNPIKHVDAVGTIILPLFLFLFKAGFIFGWAKPVPVNYNNLKHKKRDIILVASAGVAANLILAFISAFFLKLLENSVPHLLTGLLALFFLNMLIFNVFLAVFNLIPIPPLDGSKILLGWSENKKIKTFLNSDKQGLSVLIFLLFIIPMIFSLFNINFNPLTSAIRYISSNIINILT